jgi:anti-sigma factor (TIGR02949 family)
VNCTDARDLLHACLDGELDADRRTPVERHLDACPECRREWDTLRALRSAVRDEAVKYTAPESLRERIRAALPVSAEPFRGPRRRLLPWLGVAVAAVLVVGLAAFVAWQFTGSLTPPVARDRLVQEVTASHARSLLADGVHLVDVPGPDRHVVKPWFQTRLDYAPAPVKDWKDQGFELKGGRLDYLDNRPVAALVYSRRLHFINLFIWPAADGDAVEGNASRRGYHLLYWTKDGMHYWAVSDLNLDDLRTFTRLVRDEGP